LIASLDLSLSLLWREVDTLAPEVSKCDGTRVYDSSGRAGRCGCARESNERHGDVARKDGDVKSPLQDRHQRENFERSEWRLVGLGFVFYFLGGFVGFLGGFVGGFLCAFFGGAAGFFGGVFGVAAGVFGILLGGGVVLGLGGGRG
jgi:hypothetical protein